MPIVDVEVVSGDREGATANGAGVLADALGVHVAWRQADLLAWSPGSETYDLVLLVFIHLPATERERVYASAAAAVAPGGSLLVVAHDRSNLVDGVGGRSLSIVRR